MNPSNFINLHQNKDIDIVERSYRFKFMAYYAAPAMFFGFLGFIALSAKYGTTVGIIGGLAIVIFVGTFMYNLIGKFSKSWANIYYTAGGKAKKQYSMEKALIMQEKYEEAIELYKKELTEDPEDFQAQLEIAELIADELEDYPRAIKEFRKTQAMQIPDELNVYISARIVDIYANEIKNYDKAIGECKRVIRNFPQASENFNRLLNEMEERKYLEQHNK